MNSQIIPQSSDDFQTFNFNGIPVRGKMRDDGNPVILADDICKALAIVNTRQAVAALPDDEKGVCKVYTPGGTQEVLCVTEAGLYRLIFRSNKPEAEAFRKKVFSEILPAIRKNGSYSVQPMTSAEIILMHAQRLVDHERQLAAQADAIKRIEARQDVQDQEHEYMTVRGYAAYIHRNIDNATAGQLGKRATRHCNAELIHIGKKKDAIYGWINTYPDHILKVVFNEWYSQLPLEIE